MANSGYNAWNAKERVEYAVTSTWRLLKAIGDLKIARTFGICWSSLPAKDVVSRHLRHTHGPSLYK